ncbi:MAG: phosphoenolpyruvate carboxylase [Desulfurococcaceae archaeon]
MTEEIPRLMCTQHPDSATKVSTAEEVDEAIQSFTLFGCEEVMSDYEGKLTPYAQPKDIVIKAHKAELALGTDFLITPRIPNPSLEEMERVVLSIDAALIANYYSYKLLGAQAVKWVILPMVEDPLIVELVHRLLVKKANVLREELKVPVNNVQIIPLVEDVDEIINVHRHINAVLRSGEEMGIKYDSIRVFLGKSDASVRNGHIASSISIVYSLNLLRHLKKRLGMNIYPIIGMGSPPFRGGLNNPRLVDMEVDNYRGYYTTTIQSAVRYDIPYHDYIGVKKKLWDNVGKEPRYIDAGDSLKIIRKAGVKYRSLVSRYIDVINKYAHVIPSTRDRVVWREYGRVVVLEDRRLNVPRAIMYTAIWYLVGIPPVYLDAPFIIETAKNGELEELLKLLPYLVDEWKYESSYYSPSIASKRLDESIVHIVNEALDILGIKPEPNDSYVNLLSMNPMEPYVLSLAKIRGFLG